MHATAQAAAKVDFSEIITIVHYAVIKQLLTKRVVPGVELAQNICKYLKYYTQTTQHSRNHGNIC